MSLDAELKALEKKYGKNTVTTLTADVDSTWPSVPTGALTLDVELGIGGLPLGRVVEVAGNEGSGKTTLALTVCANAQKQGMKVCYVDVESALDPVYAQNIGVNLDDMLISQPQSAEEGLGVAEAMVRSGEVQVIVVDSVAALTPMAEVEGDIGDAHVGRQARLMGQALRMLNPLVHKNNVLLIFINQLRSGIGPFASSNVTPGGRALKFYSSVRLFLRQTEQIKNGAEVVGIRVQAETKKNKMAPPYRKAEYDILFGSGINSLGCVLDLAEQHGIVKKSGAWYSYNDQQLGQGRAKTIEALMSDLDLADEIERLVRDAAL